MPNVILLIILSLIPIKPISDFSLATCMKVEPNIDFIAYIIFDFVYFNKKKLNILTILVIINYFLH